MEIPNGFFAFLDDPLYASEEGAAFVKGGSSLEAEWGPFPDENAENAPPVATEVGPREPTHPLHPREPGREPSHRGQWLTAVYLQNRLEQHNNPHPDPYDPHPDPDDPYSKRWQDEVHLSLGPSAMRTEKIPKEMRMAMVEKRSKGVWASQEEIPKAMRIAKVEESLKGVRASQDAERSSRGLDVRGYEI